jgi:hypothetical protein
VELQRSLLELIGTQRRTADVERLHGASTVAFAAVTAGGDGAQGATPNAPVRRETLELRDLVIGVQAQLDELHARLDGLEARLRALESVPARAGFVRRARARAGAVKRSVGRRPR